MTNELSTANGELRADGSYVIAKHELVNGTRETHRVGKLKIRGEREPRTITFGDYTKLLTFYSAQERLIKDRKHVMVVLSDKTAVNTADITSLTLEDEERWAPKVAEVTGDIRKLPTAQLLLNEDCTIYKPTAAREDARAIKDRNFFLAKCHYRERDGQREYITQFDKIPEALKMAPSDDGYEPVITQIYKYGIPQLETTGSNSQK